MRKTVAGYLILWVFVVLSLALAYVADQHAQEAIQVNCNLGNQNREVMRLILIDANERTQTSRQRTPAEKRAAAQFYERQLARLPDFDCSKIVP